MKNGFAWIRESSWGRAIIALIKRIYLFISNPTLVFYFLVVILIAASLGVWYPFIGWRCSTERFLTSPATITNLATYSISILAAIMADFLLGRKQRGLPLRMFVFSLFLLSFLFSFIGLSSYDYRFGYAGLFVMLFVWIIVYADDASKGSTLDDSNKEAFNSTGGVDPRKVELPGTTTGFVS